MDGNSYTLRNSKLFDKQAEEIGEIRHIDEALLILTFAISRNPDPFPTVPGYENIKIAKTDAYMRNEVSVPPLRLWFQQVDENTIELMAIEPYEKETDG